MGCKRRARRDWDRGRAGVTRDGDREIVPDWEADCLPGSLVFAIGFGLMFVIGAVM